MSRPNQNSVADVGRDFRVAHMRPAPTAMEPSSAGDADPVTHVAHYLLVPPPAEPASRDAEDQKNLVIHHAPVPASRDPLSASDEDQSCCVTQRPLVPSLAETIELIKAAHRERCFWMEQRKRSDLSLGAYLRTTLGWSLALPTAERDRIKQHAAELIKLGERYVKAKRRAERKAAPLPSLPAALDAFAHVVVNAIELRGKTDELEAEAGARMESLARSLPVFEFTKSQRGFAALGLAIIVAEAGRDLRDYATKGKLYKRMGLAVIDGKRQGGLTKTASKDEWIAHGYVRVRRSRIWTIGTAVLMAGNPRYRQIYLDRKLYEAARAEAEGLTVAPAAKIPKKRAAEYRSLGHIDARARRYAEKHLLCDLWRAWKRLTPSDRGAVHDPAVAQLEHNPPRSDLSELAAE
jgi:hypothetical protein